MSGEPGAMSGQPRPDTGAPPNAEPVHAEPVHAEPVHAEPAATSSSDAATIPADAGAIPPGETTAAPASAAAPATAGTMATPVRRPRRLAIVAGLTRLARLTVAVALLVAGVAIGYQTFLNAQPAQAGPVADPATAGNLPAPVVRELLAAIGRNDADAIRSAVPAVPYKALTAEMSRWEIHEVTKVETLATYEDGPRTATAFVMIGRDSAKNPVAINLIVETEAGNIVGFK